MVSSLETGIVTTPTLFGLDPHELVDCVSVDGMRERREREAEVRQTSERKPAVFRRAPFGQLAQRIILPEYDSVFDLLADTSGDKHIRQISQYAWVQVGANRYVLCSPSGTYLRLAKVDDEEAGPWRFQEPGRFVALPRGLSKSPYATPRELLTAVTFADAVHGCDQCLPNRAFPHRFISRRVSWRNLPATDGQLEFLNKIRDGKDSLVSQDITKGEAMDMITRVKARVPEVALLI